MDTTRRVPAVAPAGILRTSGAGREHAEATRLRAPRSSFHLWNAVAMNLAMVAGFWFTYFDPMLQGVYPQVSPLVHVHGATFFLWYPLLVVQAGLIRADQVRIHRVLGYATVGMAAVMIAVGLIVSTVKVEMARGAGGDPFWSFMGLPIFSIWILFTAFIAAAISHRRRPAIHKRFILLASAVALSAGTFRIVVRILGFGTWIAIFGMLAATLFVAAGMIDDLRSRGRVHPVYRWGLAAMVGMIGGTCLLATTSGGEVVKEGVAWIGRMLMPLY